MAQGVIVNGDGKTRAAKGDENLQEGAPCMEMASGNYVLLKGLCICLKRRKGQGRRFRPFLH